MFKPFSLPTLVAFSHQSTWLKRHTLPSCMLRFGTDSTGAVQVVCANVPANEKTCAKGGGHEVSKIPKSVDRIGGLGVVVFRRLSFCSTSGHRSIWQSGFSSQWQHDILAGRRCSRRRGMLSWLRLSQFVGKRMLSGAGLPEVTV